MKNYEFVVWLEGYLDLCESSELTLKKLHIIRNHLHLVKAVEGELGKFNQKIYDKIALAIDSPQKNLVLYQQMLRDEINHFLKEAF